MISQGNITYKEKILEKILPQLNISLSLPKTKRDRFNSELKLYESTEILLNI